MTAPTKSADGTWDVALKCSKEIGYVPGAFSEAIRLLYSDHFTNKQELKPVTKYQIARVLRSPNFKSMLYFASRSLAPDVLQASEHVTVGTLMELYNPLDLATMIAALVLSRKVRKVAGHELWTEIRPRFSRESLVGGYVGVAIPSIGFAPGILWGAMPHLSHALLASKKPESYYEYRDKIEKTKKSVVPEAELAVWGTTSSQVTSVVLTQLGFKKDFASLVDRAATYGNTVASIQDDMLRKMRLGLLWFDCFAAGSEQPRERLSTKDFPFKTDRDRVDTYMKKLSPSDVSWLERSGDDMSPEKTPELFKPQPAIGEFEVPDQLKEVFTLEEITSMEEVDFDKLVDHIDLESEEKESSDILSTDQLRELESMVG